MSSRGLRARHCSLRRHNLPAGSVWLRIWWQIDFVMREGRADRLRYEWDPLLRVRMGQIALSFAALAMTQAPTIERPTAPPPTQPVREREGVRPERRTDISRTPPPDEMREVTKRER